ncbi:MAG: TonB-dependent receptor [Chryseolinea sp.]
MLATQVLAQDINVSGKVADPAGGTMPGVNVLVKGTPTGTVTDQDGRYTLTAPADATLIFTFVGYTTTEVPIGGRTVIDVTIKEDMKSLDEVVVIGYGTQKRSDLTGAVGSVNESSLRERPSTSLNQQLSGKIAGVQVNTNSGRPGGRTNIRVRGFSSINSSNNPLYVVDGVQLPQGNQDQFSQSIDYINPNDIVSVEVLKDASSTAIYGARGANGVILITTKRGKAGEGKVTYDVNFSVPTVGPNKREALNAKEYIQVEDLAYANMEKFDKAGWDAGKYTNLNPAVRRVDPRVWDANGNNLYDTDWLKETTQHKLSQNHQLGFSGGNEKTTYSLSLGYRDDEGLLKKSYLNRYSGRLTIDDQVKKWLKVGATLSYNHQTENLVDISDQVARQIVEDFPFLPVRYEDGKFANNRDYPNAEGTMSSVHRLFDRKYILQTQTTLGSVFTNLTLAKGLEMKTVLGANIVTQQNDEAINSSLNTTGIGQSLASTEKQTFWSLENYLTYNKTFSEIHSLTALAGISWQEQNRFYTDIDVRNFPSDYLEFNNLGAGNDNKVLQSNAYRYALSSYFGRINYSLMGKYLFTVTGRADGSSKFGDNNKYSFFPSAALAWKISDEGFLKDNRIISNLKLRTSYGLTGNSEIPAYSSLSLLGSNYRAIWSNASVGGTGLNRLANPDLRWEKTAQSDLGIELGLFNDRVTLEADVYYRKTTDMLLVAPVPQTSGYAIIRKNVGSMQNKGLEVAITTTNIQTDKFVWRTTINASSNRNKVLSLATPSDIFNVGGPGITNPTSIIRIGAPADSLWGLTRLGVWGTSEADEAAKYTSYRNGLTILPGDIKYKDVNGDYAITDADRSIIGRGSPDVWGGFVNYIKYGPVDLTIDLQYSYGNDIMDMNLHSSEDRQGLANSYKTVLNAWTPENQNTMIAQVRGTSAGYVTNVDSHWVQDGSFVRGRNLLLGYTVPGSMLQKLSLDRLRIYASAQNFFLIVADEVIGDPEVTPLRGGNGDNAFSQGMKWHEYPKATTFMLGLQIGL